MPPPDRMDLPEPARSPPGRRRGGRRRRWMRSRTERMAAGVLLAAVLVAAARHELGWARGGGAAAEVDTTPVGIVLLASTTDSGLEDSTRLVVRDSAALAAVWPGLALGTRPPVVSFEGGLVVILGAGRRPSGGYSITADSATREGDTLRVHVTTTVPGRGCVTTQALTAPAAAVRVDDSAPVVSFVEATRVVECGRA